MPSLDPSATAHATRYLRLVEVLRFESLVEPRYDADSPEEWLAWAHNARWMIVRSEAPGVFSRLFETDRRPQRAMYESRTHSLMLGVDSLRAPRSFPEIDGLIRYLDEVFFHDGRQANDLGSLYPTIAMSGDCVQAEQGNDFEELVLTHPRYHSEPMVLGDYRHIAGNFEALGRSIRDLVVNQEALLGIIAGLLGNDTGHIGPVRHDRRLPIGRRYREVLPERARQGRREGGR